MISPFSCQTKNPPPDDFKDKDADWLIKNATREQLVACFVEKHGHFPDQNDTKEKLAKAIIVASGRDFYLHLSAEEIKAKIVKEIGFRYNYDPGWKTLVKHLQIIEVKHANVSNDLSPSSLRPAHIRLIFFPL